MNRACRNKLIDVGQDSSRKAYHWAHMILAPQTRVAAHAALLHVKCVVMVNVAA
jgi:hypothetical protein